MSEQLKEQTPEQRHKATITAGRQELLAAKDRAKAAAAAAHDAIMQPARERFERIRLEADAELRNARSEEPITEDPDRSSGVRQASFDNRLAEPPIRSIEVSQGLIGIPRRFRRR